MDSDSTTGSRPDYLGALRRQWYIVVASAVIGLLVGMLLVSSLPKAYASSASVLVEPTNSNTTSSDARTVGVINMDTEVQIVKSLPVASAVKTATGSPLTAAQLSKRVTASVPANTTILQIGFQDTSAASAQAVAQAFAVAYIDFRNQQSTDMIQAQELRFSKQATATSAAITRLNQKIARLPTSSASRADAEQTLAQFRSRLRWIDQQLLPLQAQPVAAGSVIVAAPLNPAPVKPSKILVGGSATALFVLLGIVLAWWRDGRQGRIRRIREIEEELGVSVLGMVDDTRLSAVQGHGRAVQQYRRVVHAAAARMNDSAGAVLVTGVGAHSMGEEVAATLSAEWAHTGTQVRLIYSDERAAQIFGDSIRSEPAFRSTPLTCTSLGAALVTVDGDVEDRALPQFLQETLADDLCVVIATPPTGLSADAQAMSPHARFTLLVITLNQSTLSEVGEALRQLRQVGVTDVGAIVVGRSSRKERSRSRALVEDRRHWLEARAPQVKGPGPADQSTTLGTPDPTDREDSPARTHVPTESMGSADSADEHAEMVVPTSKKPSSQTSDLTSDESSAASSEERSAESVEASLSSVARGPHLKRSNGGTAKLPSVPIKRTR